MVPFFRRILGCVSVGLVCVLSQPVLADDVATPVDANQATDKANQATDKANQATDKANQATDKANQATDKAIKSPMRPGLLWMPLSSLPRLTRVRKACGMF